MESPEKLFFTKLIRGRCYNEFIRTQSEGFRTDVFSELYHPVLDYINHYVVSYQQLPSEDEVREKFPKSVDILFDDKVPEAAFGAIYDNVIADAVRKSLHGTLQEVVEKYNDAQVDPMELLEHLTRSANWLTSNYLVRPSDVTDFSDLASTVLAELEGNVEVSRGYAPSFLFVEDQMRGWQPADLTTIVAKTSVGKTWALLQNSITAATGNPFFFYTPEEVPSDLVYPSLEDKKARSTKCLIVSLEMPALAVARRLAALVSKTSYARYRRNELSGVELESFKNALNQIQNISDEDSIGANLRVIGPNTADTPESIYAAAEEYEAGMVVIDGFYLMQGNGQQRWEKVEDNMRQLRLHSLKSNRHYMLASQLRREAKTVDSTTIDTLAFSASIGHDSTNILALVKDKADIQNNTMTNCVLKMRDGIPDQKYSYDWDFHESRFTQQGLVDEDDVASSFSLFN